MSAAWVIASDCIDERDEPNLLYWAEDFGGFAAFTSRLDGPVPVRTFATERAARAAFRKAGGRLDATTRAMEVRS
jgi:hypothetical protein